VPYHHFRDLVELVHAGRHLGSPELRIRFRTHQQAQHCEVRLLGAHLLEEPLTTVGLVHVQPLRPGAR
jgi:hypothetical protein